MGRIDIASYLPFTRFVVFSMKQFTNAPGVPAPVGSYSQAILSGNLLFCSGQIALSPESGTLIEGGVEKETGQVLSNLRGVLAHAGLTPADIVSTTIFLI